ncbi:MAG TPA: ElyC/SanA/YdcF family protein [Polyangia bacterium]
MAVPPAVVAANLHVFRGAAPFIYDSVANVPARAVAIVPGTNAKHGVPSLMLAERLTAALMLYRAGKTPIILVSGSHFDFDDYNETTAMHRWLVQHGVSDGAIVDDAYGFRTLDTMERAARIFKVTGAVICSQGMHLPRSVFLARQAGIDAVGLVSNPGGLAHVLYSPHETMASALALVETTVGHGPAVLGPVQPIGSDTRTTALR